MLPQISLSLSAQDVLLPLRDLAHPATLPCLHGVLASLTFFKAWSDGVTP